MKRNLFFLLFNLLIAFRLATYSTQAQSFDKELAELATSVSKSLQETERKKATVLDFVDLQGNASELGRFIAEQFSVALVMNRKGFSLMDRANLKTILAEHKLSISGLVEPENAKKLGQFSGVDAIVLGNITALKEEIVVTVKIIATDTAEILGAAKTRIQRSKDIEALFTNAIAATTPEKAEGAVKSVGQPGQPVTNTAIAHPQADFIKHLQVDKNSTRVADLFIRVESIRLTSESGTDYLVATLAMVNTRSNAIAASLRRESSTLTDKSGSVFNTRGGGGGINGIGTYHPSFQGEQITHIESMQSVKVTIRHRVEAGNPSRKIQSAGPPYRLEFGVRVGLPGRAGGFEKSIERAVLIDISEDK